MRRCKYGLSLRYFVLFVAALLLLVPLHVDASSDLQSAAKFSIDLHKALGLEYVCETGHIQFLSEKELLLLAGPTEDCYRSVSQLELVVLSLDGHIVARKSWPSTYPVIVLSPDRFASVRSDEIQVFDEHLAKIQSLPLPEIKTNRVRYFCTYLPGQIAVTAEGETSLYGGMPLRRIGSVEGSPFSQANTQLFYVFDDGRKLVKSGNRLLIESTDGAQPVSFADLNWVIPCEKYCQSYEAGTSHEVVTGSKRRILFISNGSRVPITDAAGLFPYFRLEVFDLDTGAEIYREEKISKTGKRSAAVSPDGDLLAISAGNVFSFVS